MRGIFFFTLLLISVNIIAQNKQTDIILLLNTDITISKPKKEVVPHLQTKKQSFLAKYNPVSLLLKGSMFTYQNVISPQLGQRCLYHTSCSNFSKQSIGEFGMVKGVFLSADRLLRCNRISSLDLHPLNFDVKSRKYLDTPTQYRFSKTTSQTSLNLHKH